MEMNNRRKLFIALGASAVAAPFGSFAQQPTQRMHRIGFLSPASASTYGKQLEAFKVGLRDFGYVEGKNIEFEIRWAEGRNDRLPNLVAELVSRNVDVIVMHGMEGTLAAMQRTQAIPLVSAVMGDPVASGLVASLARPGGNLTGMAIFSKELYVKRLGLLKEAVPRIRRVAFLMTPDNPIYGPIFQSMETAAKSLGVELQRFDARGANELNGAFAAMTKARVDALEISEDAAYFTYVISIANLAIKHRLPSISTSEFARAGVLIGYGVSRPDLFRRAAGYVDKIFKGAKPGDLPIEQPTQFEFIINMKTAKALGIKVPQSILLRSDAVIE
jgi:putative ABC transport system substrate-binding protein